MKPIEVRRPLCYEIFGITASSISLWIIFDGDGRVKVHGGYV